MKHTPGNWTAGNGIVITDKIPKDYKPGSGHDETDYYGGFLIAESVNVRDVNLIAAAPELLMALNALRNYVTDNFNVRGDNILSIADAAIKKATQ
jgi:hypothetical protein